MRSRARGAEGAVQKDGRYEEIKKAMYDKLVCSLFYLTNDLDWGLQRIVYGFCLHAERPTAGNEASMAQWYKDSFKEFLGDRYKESLQGVEESGTELDGLLQNAIGFYRDCTSAITVDSTTFSIGENFVSEPLTIKAPDQLKEYMGYKVDVTGGDCHKAFLDVMRFKLGELDKLDEFRKKLYDGGERILEELRNKILRLEEDAGRANVKPEHAVGAGQQVMQQAQAEQGAVGVAGIGQQASGFDPELLRAQAEALGLPPGTDAATVLALCANQMERYTQQSSGRPAAVAPWQIEGRGDVDYPRHDQALRGAEQAVRRAMEGQVEATNRAERAEADAAGARREAERAEADAARARGEADRMEVERAVMEADVREATNRAERAEADVARVRREAGRMEAERTAMEVEKAEAEEAKERAERELEAVAERSAQYADIAKTGVYIVENSDHIIRVLNGVCWAFNSIRSRLFGGDYADHIIDPNGPGLQAILEKVHLACGTVQCCYTQSVAPLVDTVRYAIKHSIQFQNCDTSTQFCIDIILSSTPSLVGLDGRGACMSVASCVAQHMLPRSVSLLLCAYQCASNYANSDNPVVMGIVELIKLMYNLHDALHEFVGLLWAQKDEAQQDELLHHSHQISDTV